MKPEKITFTAICDLKCACGAIVPKGGKAIRVWTGTRFRVSCPPCGELNFLEIFKEKLDERGN